MGNSLENAQVLASIHSLVDAEFVQRGRLCPIAIQRTELVRAALIEHLQQNPVENLEVGVHLVESTIPLSKLVEEVRKHFPELNLSYILDN